MSPLPFTGLALDRHAEERDDPDWLAAQHAHPAARFLLLAGDGHGSRPALVRADGSGLHWLDAAACRALGPELEPYFLGNDGEGPVFALAAEGTRAAALPALPGTRWMELRQGGLELPPLHAGLFALAHALAFWRLRSRWCGACGSALERLPSGHRARCPDCGLEHFPRLDPAMIVAVTHEGRCLLGNQAGWGPRRWSTLAGFIEPGESAEDAVRREVREEAGVRVGACHYHSSQPWPFPASLMLAYHAEALDPAIRTGPELHAARWFTPDELVAGMRQGELVLPGALSVSHALIADWLRDTAGLELARLQADNPA